MSLDRNLRLKIDRWVVLLTAALVAVLLGTCSGKEAIPGGSWRVFGASNPSLQTQMDADSVLCYIFPPIVRHEEGRVVDDLARKAVQNSVQSFVGKAVFMEIFSTDPEHPYFLYNLEAIRRHVIAAGVDPVLVSTCKRTRPLQNGSAGLFGFSLVLARQ